MGEGIGNGNSRRLGEWGPTIALIVAGIAGWGAMSTGVSELQRRVAVLEAQQAERQGAETGVAVKLAALDEKLTALRAQVGDIADQLRQQRRP